MSDGQGSRLVDQEENDAETEREIRNYKLNKQNSLQKKLEATQRDDIQIFNTGGGLKIIFNTGMYELIKYSADKYYASKECKRIPVQDKQDNLVETKFKMKSGKQDLYTLNMYHTKCTCLVNGRQPGHFLQEDLPSILKKVELNLQQNSVTVDEINQRFQTILLSCASFVSENQQNVHDEHENELKALASAVQNVRENRHALNKKDTTNSDTKCDCLNSVKDQLNRINEVVEVLRNELKGHMKSTNEQIGEIKDNVVSLKKQYQVYSRDIQSEVDAVSETTSILKEKLESVNVDLSRKLQSVSDMLKVSKSDSSIQTPGKQKKMGQISSEKTRIDQTYDTSRRNDKSSSEENPNGEKKTAGLQPATSNTCVADNSTSRKSKTASDLDNKQNSAKSVICPGTIQKTTIRSYSHKSNKSPSQGPEPRNNPEEKKKTLIIGDSILKGIQLRGLQKNVSVMTFPGKKANDIRTKLQRFNLTLYENVIIYIGGNDAADGSLQAVYNTLKNTIKSLQDQCTFYICTLCPRRDTDVIPLNDALKQLGEELDIGLIDCYQSFIYGNGNIAKTFYSRDGIHLNPSGSSMLVASINSRISIIKQHKNWGLEQPYNRSQIYVTSRNRYRETYGNHPSFNRRYKSHLYNGRFGNQPNISNPQRNRYNTQLKGNVWTMCRTCGMNNHKTMECRRNRDCMDSVQRSRSLSTEDKISNTIIKDAAVADDNNQHRNERKTLLIKEKTEKSLSLKIQWYVYLSHFLSAWGDRMWQFGVGLFMVIISPDSLLLTATNGFATGGAVLLFGTLVGDWIDKTPRLRAARATLLAQNLSVVACSIVLYFVITYKEEIESYWPNSGLLTLTYVIIITLATVSQLASAGTTIAVERDWIVEICENDTDLLAATSAKLKGIDMITNIVAPIATGQIMYFTSENIGALFIGGWNLVSVGVEYYLLWKVHELVPRLKEKKYKSNAVAGEAEPEQARCTSCLRSMVSGFVIIFRGWKTYTKYEAAFAGLGLAFLYMTVLGFDNITVGFAYTQGVNESIMGALMAAGALFGILGALIYPCVRKKVGIERTGLYGLFSQVVILSLCVVSVWAPGSPFDPYIRLRVAETIPAQNVSMAVTKNTTVLSDNTNVFYSTDYDGGNLDDIYSNMSSYDVTGTEVSNLLIGSGALETVTETTKQTADEGWKNYISVGLLMCGIIGARCGLWMADLSINQIFLETVAETERGIVLGVQTSLNQFMDMLKFVMVMVAPEPELFGILVVISFTFVCLGWAFYAKFSFSARKHLFHIERVIVCRQGYEAV